MSFVDLDQSCGKIFQYFSRNCRVIVYLYLILIVLKVFNKYLSHQIIGSIVFSIHAVM